MRALCKNEAVMAVVQSIIDNGGEGLILQKCGSPYDVGRSESVIKLKAFSHSVLIFSFPLLFSPYFLITKITMLAALNR